MNNMMMNPRSRGLMLQQSANRPSEKQIRVNQGSNVTQSVANSAMTSPKLHRHGDSVTASNSKWSSTGAQSSHLVHELGPNTSEGGVLIQSSVPRGGKSMQSPSQENISGQQPMSTKAYNMVQKSNQLKYHKGIGVNVSSDLQSDRFSPIKKDSLRKTGLSKRTEISTSNNSMNQPRILSKTSKNSTAVSKEHLLMKLP